MGQHSINNYKGKFHSSLSTYMISFIRERNLYTSKDECVELQYTMGQLDRYLVSIGYTKKYLNQESIKGWLGSFSGIKDITLYRKYIIVAKFARYLCEMGMDSYIIRAPRKLRHCDFVPHIFTHEEIQMLFNTADSLRQRSTQSKSFILIMPALLRLLYSTGIRIGEALNIKNEDIDFDRKVIVINKSKNGKQRYAPINDSLEFILREYLAWRTKIKKCQLDKPNAHFFVNFLGNNPCLRAVQTWFKKILDQSNIVIKGDPETYRLHAIRHTACVHAMMKLSKGGMNVYAYLPVLATFMGHKHINDTEYYLRLTLEMYPEILKIDKHLTPDILNKLSKYSNMNYEYE